MTRFCGDLSPRPRVDEDGGALVSDLGDMGCFSISASIVQINYKCEADSVWTSRAMPEHVHTHYRAASDDYVTPAVKVHLRYSG